MTALYPKGNSRRKESFLFLIMFFLFITGCNTIPGIKAEESQKVESAPAPEKAVTVKSTGSIIGNSASADSIQSVLKGKWLRSDGTYSVEIFSVKEGGKMDAGYFNPNPINVGSSAWMITGGNIVIEIVLKDANYPGSKYNLIYDRQNDLLRGNYFQAVQGINYDVIFARNK
jgi:hypothetical protein